MIPSNKEKQEVTIELTAPSAGGADSKVIAYPEGFSSTNCYISSIMFYRVHPTSTAHTTWFYLSGNYNTRLQTEGVVLNVGEGFSDQFLGNPVKIVLRKYQ